MLTLLTSNKSQKLDLTLPKIMPKAADRWIGSAEPMDWSVKYLIALSSDYVGHG